MLVRTVVWTVYFAALPLLCMLSLYHANAPRAGQLIVHEDLCVEYHTAAADVVWKSGVIAESIRLDAVPEHFTAMLLFQEDQAFFDHGGYSAREIYIVLRDYLVRGDRLRGASTITQQLARALFLSQERSLRRKLLEFRTALLLEHRLTKLQILELYINHVYWGARLTGLAEASRHYFRTDAARLSRHQAALLIAILPEPNACQNLLRCADAGVLRRAQRLLERVPASDAVPRTDGSNQGPGI